METFSDFLIPLKFTLDEPSKKKFDAAIGEVEKKFAAIGAAAGAAAIALGFAVKEISKNLANLAYSAERVGTLPEEFKALGNAADRIGIGAEAARSSLTEFFAFVNFQGGASAIKQWFNIDFDPFHPLKGWLDSAVKLADEYASGSVPRRQTAIREAQRAGINETLLTTPGAARRLRDEMEKDKAFTGGALDPIAEKAKRLNADFEKVKQHLKTIGELASGSVQDAFSDLLETVDGWLAAHKDTIIWFSDKAAEISIAIASKSKEIFVKYEKITAELLVQYGITQKIDATLKGIGKTLQSFWDGSITSKIHAALEWAFQPFKWLWDKLWNLGLVSGPAGSMGSDVGPGGGFTRGAAMESGGHGTQRRGAFGHGGRARGAGGGGGMGGGGGGGGGTAHPRGSAQTNIAPAMAAMEDQLRKEGVPEANVHAAAALLIGQALSESPLNPDEVHDQGTGYGIYGARLDRKTRMLAWLAAHGYARNSLEGQARYMGHEAMTDSSYAATRRELMRANEENIGSATRVITPNFEGPTRDNSAARIPNVRAALANSRRGVKPPSATAPSDFRKELDRIQKAKPLAPWQQSMNHDHRILNSNVNVHVAGGFPVDKTGRPLERTKHASLIRNTTSTAA